MKKFLLAIVVVAEMVFAANADGFSYSKSVNFKITYEGAAVSDFPLLLKLDTTKVPDIYETVVNAGVDLHFASLDGETEYPYEVDTWNPSGTSLVWVKVPSFEKNAQFMMQYGCADKTSNSGSAAVWSGYDLVCHVNGDAHDSAISSHVGYLNPSGTTKNDGIIGKTYGTDNASSGAAMINTIYSGNAGLLPDGVFTCSFWLRANIAFSNFGLIAGPCSASDGDTWGIRTYNPASKIYVRTAKNSETYIGQYDFGVDAWHKIDFVIEDTKVLFYVDGVQFGDSLTMTSGPKKMWINDMAWGGTCAGNAGFGSNGLAVDIDECRIFSTVADAARVAADYAVVTGDCCEAVSADAPYVTIDSITADPVGGYVPATLTLEASATLHNASGTLVYHWDLDGDGEFDDAEGVDKTSVEVEVTEAASFTPGVKVTVADTELFAVSVMDTPLFFRERSIDLSFEVSPCVVDVPATVTFTATAVRDGIEGELTYVWKTNGVELARTTVSNYQFVHTEVSSFVPSVTVLVEGSEYTVSVVGQEVLAVASYYVDSDAESDGVGTRENPFKDISEAFSRIHAAKAIYIKGSFVLPTEGVEFSRNGFVFGKWGEVGDPKPVLYRDDNAQAPSTGIFRFTGENVRIEDVAFRYPKEMHYGGPMISVETDGALIRNCEFELTTTPEKACYNGVIVGAVEKKWTVDGCSFKGYGVPNGEVAYRVICVCGEVMVRNSSFENCASILAQQSTTNPWSSKETSFVSNVVWNSTATSLSGANAGAVAVCDSWKFCNGLTIAHNVLVNTDASAGCVATIRGGSNPYQNAPLTIRNNTIVGYEAVVEVDNLTCESTKSYFAIFNNLCNGAIPFYADAQEGWHLKADTAFIKNNVQTGDAVYAVPNYTLTDHATVEGNQKVAAIRFCSTDRTDSGFYRPKGLGKTDFIASGGWTDGGRYPAYIGAVAPNTSGGMVIFVR